MSNFVNESQPYWLVNNANAVVTNSATNLLGFFVNGANGGGAITLSNGTGGDAVINNYVPLSTGWVAAPFRFPAGITANVVANATANITVTLSAGN